EAIQENEEVLTLAWLVDNFAFIGPGVLLFKKGRNTRNYPRIYKAIFLNLAHGVQMDDLNVLQSLIDKAIELCSKLNWITSKLDGLFFGSLYIHWIHYVFLFQISSN
ncbi:hypothetical protein ACJX0J_028080, partial [Zea mays]